MKGKRYKGKAHCARARIGRARWQQATLAGEAGRQLCKLGMLVVGGTSAGGGATTGEHRAGHFASGCGCSLCANSPFFLARCNLEK